MTTLYLIRHGATAPNLQRPYVLQGQGVDLPLAPLGEKQAERVRDLLAPLGIAAVCSSPLLRARQTAEIAAAGRPVRLVEALKEGDVGRWEGKSYEQIEAEDGAAWRRFRDDPATNGYPGGESFAAVLERAAPALAAIAAAHEGQAVAVVSHQIVSRVYLASLLGMPLALARRLKTANGGVSAVQFSRGQPSVQTLNAAFHLAGVMTPD